MKMLGKWVMCVLVCGVAAGCATKQAATSGSAPEVAPSPVAKGDAQPYGPARKVMSRDGKTEGEVYGTPAAGGKFSKLAIGMTFSEVTTLIGGPDNMVRHETGKRWIPFYYGNDSQRLQVLYRGEGCLTYTGGNVFGGGGNELIRITATPSPGCLE